VTAGPDLVRWSVRTRATRIRFALWAGVVAALLSGHAAWLYSLRGVRILNRDTALIAGQGFLAALLIGLARLLKTTPPDAIKLRRRTSERLILTVAIVLQLLAVVTLTPALTEDLIRYRLDGRMWLAGRSPYAMSPAEWFEADGGTHPDALDRLVTYPEVRTIYPPVAEATFALAASAERMLPTPRPLRVTHPAECSPYRARSGSRPPWQWFLPLRLLLAATAVGGAAVLLLILRHRGESAWWAVLFAWNPLVVLEAGGMGHVDVVGVLFLLVAMYYRRRHRPAACGLALALAAGVKPIALLALPFLCLGARPGHAARLVAGFAVAVIAVFVPALLVERGYAGLMETAANYGGRWEANASVYELFKRLFGEGDEGRAMARAKEMARLAGALLLLVTAWLACNVRARPESATYWLMLVLLLVSPVVYPWYLTWCLCLVPLLRGTQGWAALVWSGTAALAYTSWHRASWLAPPGVSISMYTPVYAVLAIEGVVLLRRGMGRKGASDAGRVTAESASPATSR
jgi:hypothetical protein